MNLKAISAMLLAQKASTQKRITLDCTVTFRATSLEFVTRPKQRIFIGPKVSLTFLTKAIVQNGSDLGQ